MIDITRLMFDDGANRKPIETYKTQHVQFNGKRLRWWLFDPKCDPAGTRLGFHVYAGETHKGNPYHLDAFLEDPERYLKRLTYIPKHVVALYDVLRGQMAFICMEYVDE